jgi:hypothetical protein
MEQENKYSAIEEQIDALLSDGRLYLWPPGSLTFISVNMLLILGSVALLLTALNPLILDPTPEGVVFVYVGEVVLTLTIVTPAFMVMRGFRKALGVLKNIAITLTILLALFGTLSEFKNGYLNIFIGIGLGSLLISLILLKSPTYQLFSLFTARRRELALQDIAKKKKILKKS